MTAAGASAETDLRPGTPPCTHRRKDTMTTPASLNAAADWTHVCDQLTAHARTVAADDSRTCAWIRHQAAAVRAELDQLFADVDPDLLRQIIVRSNAMLGDVALVAAGGDETATSAVGIAQTVMGVALYGGPGADA